MPFGATSNARLAEVHPLLALKVRQLEQLLNAEGIDISVVQGMRTWAEQDALYAQGRTTPGPIVTNARGGESAHNFGYAADCAPMTKDLKAVDWDASHPSWKRMEELAGKVGLSSGANWVRFVDAPHLYLANLPATPTAEMRQVLLNEGLKAFWDEFIKSGETPTS